ncbi:MAG TPA: ABC transporter substrate-binding protein [Xanthobacteraceae bacterium]|jgi:NitT/TauT family transport system substrate-binding protein|nr:ABC transporter substrate-binding protein [Xanthobacteraceae bacterium]
MRTRLAIAAALALLAHPALAADTLKLAIGQRGLWDSSFAEIGTQAGIFAKHGLELQVFYTSGGGETQQAVISGSADIGVSPGTLGVLGAFAKGAPIRIIAGEATGTAEYYFVKADSPVQKDFKGMTPEMTLAYSTAGSGTHITALRFMKDYGFTAKLTATGNVPATFTSVMSGQVDIGFSTPPFGLDALAEKRARLIALANDLPSVRNQTVRLIIANATDLAKRRDVYDRFIKAYREVIDWMYSDPKAIQAFAKYASISNATAQTVRDQFYPKSMLQLDEVKGMPELMQDAVAFKYIPAALTQQQLDELLQLPKK